MDGLIEEMSAYCAANCKAYQNCEAALRSWAEKDAKQSRQTKSDLKVIAVRKEKVSNGKYD